MVNVALFYPHILHFSETASHHPHLEAVRQAIRGGSLSLQHLHHFLLRGATAIF